MSGLQQDQVGTRATDARERPAISVIVPVYNSAAMLARSLAGLRASMGVSYELIVVNDGSTDDSVRIAQQAGAHVVETGRSRSGPGNARNLGARAAQAPILLFVDADVVVRPDTLAKYVALWEADPDLTAAFGSYDTQPAAQSVLSVYRNLLHHFVHQTGREEAFSFWAGCGAVRRDHFLALGGFSPAYARPSIEDIELGYRICAVGGRIRLAKEIQVTHLKRWTFRNILETDLRDRALPWTELIARTRQLPNDLNLNAASRLSALSVFALAGLLLLGIFQPLAWVAALVPLAALLYFNRALYTFFAVQRGLWFLARVMPMHWLYYAYSAVAFAAGTLWYRYRFRGMTAPSSALSPLD